MRLLHTEPLSKVLARQETEAVQTYNIAHAHVMMTKESSDAITTHALSGELYASNSGWILLDVPNALVRGAFDALNEPGVELPSKDGKLNAHISVIRPEELEQIGGVGKISERGHHFHYTLGPVQEVEPAGWQEMSKVWFIQVKSKELQDLRKSYGLSPKPNDDKFDFHITIGVRRKNVLRNNDVAKAAEEKQSGILWPLLRLGGLMTDVVGMRALVGSPEERPEELARTATDTTHLDPLHQLPTDVDAVEKKKRKLIARPAINPVAIALSKQGDTNALLQTQKVSSGCSTTDDCESVAPETPSGQTDPPSEVVLPPAPSQTEDFHCEPAALAGIYAHYGLDKLADYTVSEGESHEPRTTRTECEAPIETMARRYADEYLRSIVVSTTDEKSAAADMDRQSVRMCDTDHNGGVVRAGAFSWASSICAASGDDKRSKEATQTSPQTEVSRSVLAEMIDKQADEQNKKHKHKALDILKALSVPTAAGLTGLALHKPTNTDVPAQVTRFPGSDNPRVVRGGIYPGARASTFEDTGGSYMVMSPEWHTHNEAPWPDARYSRTHSTSANDPASLGSVLRAAVRPEHPLDTLELHRHGSFTGQQIGAGPGSINPRTVDQVAGELNSVPHTDNATLINYGCNTGLCSPPPGSRPQSDWQQRLADLTGMTSLGARGYVTTEHGNALNAEIIAEPQGYHRIPPGTHNIGGENHAWTRYRPYQPNERVEDADLSKETYSALPAGPLHELLYNIGKPSAIAGAIAAPLLKNKQTAKRTALATSALSLPMLLSEIVMRAGEAKGQLATRGGNELSTHLNAQAKTLPYAALAALPLLSYGGANLLGRWDKAKKQKVTR